MRLSYKLGRAAVLCGMGERMHRQSSLRTPPGLARSICASQFSPLLLCALHTVGSNVTFPICSAFAASCSSTQFHAPAQRREGRRCVPKSITHHGPITPPPHARGTGSEALVRSAAAGGGGCARSPTAPSPSPAPLAL